MNQSKPSQPRIRARFCRFVAIGFCLLFAVVSSQAKVYLPAVFSDQLILQREAEVSVWGWADADEKIVVEFAGQKKSVTAAAKGKWLVKLDSLPASAEPRELVSSAQVPSPVAVRYGWANSPRCNLYNREGLPASPFRTDDWPPGISK